MGGGMVTSLLPINERADRNPPPPWCCMLPYVDLRSGRQPATGVSGWPETHKYTFVSTFVLYLRVGHNRTCEPEDS